MQVGNETRAPCCTRGAPVMGSPPKAPTGGNAGESARQANCNTVHGGDVSQHALPAKEVDNHNGEGAHHAQLCAHPRRQAGPRPGSNRSDDLQVGSLGILGFSLIDFSKKMSTLSKKIQPSIKLLPNVPERNVKCPPILCLEDGL